MPRKIKRGLSKKDEKICCSSKCNGACCGGAVYFLGFLGTAVYYIQTATGFWNGVFGVLKSIVWPAILTYKAFGFLG